MSCQNSDCWAPPCGFWFSCSTMRAENLAFSSQSLHDATRWLWRLHFENPRHSSHAGPWLVCVCFILPSDSKSYVCRPGVFLGHTPNKPQMRWGGKDFFPPSGWTWQLLPIAGASWGHRKSKMQQICSQGVTSRGNPRGYNNNHTTIRVEDQNRNEIHRSVIGPLLCRSGYQGGMGEGEQKY